MNETKKPAVRFKGFSVEWERHPMDELTTELHEYATLDSLYPLLTSSREGIMFQNEYRSNRTTENNKTLFSIVPYDYNSYPEELGLFKSFRLKTAIKTKKFNFHTDDLGSLFGYIIYLGSMEKGIVLFKKHYPISLIKRGSLLLGAKKKAERFEKLPGVDIIRMNGDAQLLRLGDTIFVLDLKMLERNMGFSTLIQQAAVETVSAIEDLDILDDIEVLRDTLEVPSFARKLSKVKKASPIFKLGISKEAIVEFTKNTPELAGKFKYSEDGTQIRLGTKKSKIAFLKLMNDAFLHSELTKQWYDASAKDNITQGAG